MTSGVRLSNLLSAANRQDKALNIGGSSQECQAEIGALIRSTKKAALDVARPPPTTLSQLESRSSAGQNRSSGIAFRKSRHTFTHFSGASRGHISGVEVAARRRPRLDARRNGCDAVLAHSGLPDPRVRDGYAHGGISQFADAGSLGNWRIVVRGDCGSHWSHAFADGVYSGVFAGQRSVRLLAFGDATRSVSLRPRFGHGRRMDGRRGAHRGDLAPRASRQSARPDAIVLCD